MGLSCSNKVHPIDHYWNAHDLSLNSSTTKKHRKVSYIRSSPSPAESSSFNNNNSNDIHCQTTRQTSLAVSKSNYEVVSNYYRSDSNEPLIDNHRTLSDSSFTFDNPAYITGSYDELTAQVSLGVNTPTIPHSYRRKIAYGHMSRSLDSIQDMAHDGGASCVDSGITLPGTVLSWSEETVNETCTVRNIVLDECGATWDVDDDTREITELPVKAADEECEVNMSMLVYPDPVISYFVNCDQLFRGL